MLKPTKKALLVEPQEDYAHVVVTEQKYATKTKGLCLTSGDDEYKYLEGKIVYFPAYKDDAEAEVNGKKYVFIEIKNVLGYDDGDDLKAEEIE